MSERRPRTDHVVAAGRGALQCRRRRRRGAAMVQTAIVMMLFLTIVFGMLDLGFAVFRKTVVSQGARQAARRVIVHGSMAPSAMGQWGPTQYQGNANATDAIAKEVAPYLAGLDPSATTVNVQWLDGNSDPESRVQITVTTTHHPLCTLVFGSTTTWTMSAVSVQQISH